MPSAPSVDLAFAKKYEGEVHAAYQRMGSKLRNTVRSVNNVKGTSTIFQKVGKGEASTKSRHGLVPVMNVDHGSVECTLGDYYAGDWVDALDMLKTNNDERQILANAGAYALGLDDETRLLMRNARESMAQAERDLEAFEALDICVRGKAA